MTIGDRIKIRREELNMSQEDLAIKLGYRSRSSINKIEQNVQNLRQSKIKAIADALDTTPAYIMGWEEKTHDYIVKLDDGTEILLETNPFSKFDLNPEQEKKVLEYIRLIKKAEGSNI